MSPRSWKLATAALVTTALGAFPAAEACNTSGGGGGKVTINKPVTINKNVNIYKPTTINKSVNVYKPVTINKDINIYKPVTINKDINITKNIDASKNITINKNIEINKSIVINKGGSSSAEASAWAAAFASASANSSASAYASAGGGNTNIVVYGGGYNEYVTVNNRTSEIGAISVSAEQAAANQCDMQEATVVKSVHAVCVAPDGHEFPASHMVGDTWVDSGMESEVLRCIPGAHLKVTLGDVLQTDQGLAGTYASGKTLECGPGEALRHFKDGMLKCVAKVPVKDCTERTNLRRWGSGDLFFSFRTTVCVPSKKTTTTAKAREIELNGLTLNGGVGEQ